MGIDETAAPALAVHVSPALWWFGIGASLCSLFLRGAADPIAWGHDRGVGGDGRSL
jgi:hypothetical protein